MFTNVKHWLQEPIALPMWSFILISIKISIIGFFANIVILREMDVMALRKTTTIGWSGTNAISNSLTVASCRFSNEQPANGEGRRMLLIHPAFLTTNESKSCNPCSFTSPLAFAQYYGIDQMYLTSSKRWLRVYRRKHICE